MTWTSSAPAVSSHNRTTGGPFKHSSAKPPSEPPPALCTWYLVQRSLLTVAMPNLIWLPILNVSQTAPERPVAAALKWNKSS